MIEVVDLFCGSGGLTHGLKKSGLKVVAGVDFDGSCKFAYEYNNNAKFIEADISKLNTKQLMSLYNTKGLKALVGCAPCQTFSSYSYKNRDKNQEDERWFLLKSFAKHISAIEPDIVSMENVPNLVKYDIFKEFEDNLLSKGYHVSYSIVNCSDYGIPQNRRRLVLLASKLGSIEILPPTNQKKTVKDAIGHLPPIKSGETNSSDPMHRCSDLSNINLKRIKQSKPGGTWRDWDKSLLPNCYKKPSGKSFSNVYGRMKWDEPSPTLTTQFLSLGSGRFGHPEQDRAISLKEGALLQTFPEDYKFFADAENAPFRVIGRHIGNAVPVELGAVIGKTIKKHLKENGHE